MEKKDPKKVKAALARAAALTPEQRRSIGIMGAKAKHGLKATHKGNFKDDFGIDVECYVLDDETKTAVISQTGMGRCLGLSVRANAFPRFIASQTMGQYVGAELREKLQKTVKFQWGSGGAEQPPSEIIGHDVTLLIDACKSVLTADEGGALKQARYRAAVKQARVILNASAKAGIKGLVYALAGYDATKQEIIDAFKFYVREEARTYESEFPPELYDQWYRLYRLTPPERNRPWKFRHLTIEHVYKPLAQSQGKVLDLTRSKKAASGDRHAKLHQFLSVVGVKALRTHLGRLSGIAEFSSDRSEYEQKVAKAFGVQLVLDV